MSEGKPVDKQKDCRAAVWPAAVLVIAVALYPVSFGPAVWLVARGSLYPSTVNRVYWPVLWCAVHGPEPVSQTISFWGSLGVSHDDPVELSVERDDGAELMVFLWNTNLRSVLPKLFRSKSRPATTRYGGVI